MSTTTELYPLTRTLTDVLDDELLHMSANMGQESLQAPKSWKNRSLEDLLVIPYQSATPSSYDSNEYKQSMFSKYADPSLTTMSMQKPSSYRKQGTSPSQVSSVTPVQATISLNKVMTNNPFASRLPNASSEIRISSPALFQGEDEDMLNAGGESFPPDFYDDDINSHKLASWPLQESATMSQDAMSIFDREFGDDFSDDDEEDYDEDRIPNCSESQCLHDRQDQDFGVLPEEDANTFNPSLNADDDSLIFDRRRPGSRFMDNSLNDNAIMEDDDVARGDDEEDDFQGPAAGVEGSFSSGAPCDKRNSSVVCLSNEYNRALPSLEGSREASLPADADAFSQRKLNDQRSLSIPSLNLGNKKKKIPARRKSSTVAPSIPIAKKKTLSESVIQGNASQEVHSCELINPVTKESCGKKFSRPYDLIRHQKTIHATKKKVFRCVICIQQQGEEGYEKTFSRGDALSRHIKVKHDLSGPEAQKAIQFAKENVEFAAA
ncbi:LADA_0E03378g1_1 [Lachancea dasiensis]|uniref:LADA_0E03378g1_1 n=1 Tax=Lachancea dasiensis TaxID=1072105 RepID=A0A1G4JB61_9SACH|nr:LADA_0E03378g1_1 [Lachancea dasiensis]